MPNLPKIECRQWDTLFSPTTQLQSIDSLENGLILHLPQLSFTLSTAEQQFLSPAISDPKSKNISFNPSTGLLSGLSSPTHYDNVKMIIQRYSQQATQLIHQLFPHYANHLIIGRTSFRPAEIAGRVTSYRKDDTRLHVDAFPATPNQGKRILRLFTNIHPGEKNRVWRIGDTFTNVAKQFLPRVRKPWLGKAELLKLLRLTKSYRTEYDSIMLQIHDAMKADLHYQATAPQQEVLFSPGSSWIVQTDQVSHAAMSGQHVLEQTFYLPTLKMKNPQLSPLKILEKMLGRTLSR